MISALALAVILPLIAPQVVSARSEQSPASDLVEAQVRLVERTREYRASLERVLAFQEADVERAEGQVQSRRGFLDRGIISRREMEETERLRDSARMKVEETRKRMAEADALMGETLGAIELAKMPKAATMELVSTPAVIRYQGTADLTAVVVGRLESFFSARFGRPLPVSAWGQTVVHDRLGLDHRHALDVAVHPDNEDGRALIEYLRLHRVPFLAFRGPIPGASTGAHVHIGRASPHLLPVRAAVR